MTSDDHALAHELATAAGRVLLNLRAQPHPTTKELRDAGDRAAHEFLVAALAEHRPDDAVLSEESHGDEAGTPASRLRSRRVWIVDPLDGTREFAEAGRYDWAVHVALWARTEGAPNGDLVAGAVALPAQGVTLSTLDPPRLPTAGSDGMRITVSRTRPPAFVERLAESLDATLVPLGSAGAKIAAVLQGKVDAYVHAGGQYEWDTAAPVAVVRAAGLHASRIDGSAVTYNHEDPTLPDILVCRSSLAPRLLAGIRAVDDDAAGAGGKVVSPDHDAERESRHAS
ncbi:MAG: 3'(2'),5'-bisphosphate nucleotidase CysQ [Streptosporangiales bacterium]|nr:3'(2'),5'-bisphosphate nucleotidase CysQ [Streptosporangiales bacterium]